MTLHDPIGTALGSIGAGSTAGASVITIGLFVFRVLQGDVDGGLTQDEQFLILTAGLGVGMITAVTTALVLSRGIGDHWRRGVIAVCTVFAATILAAGATPIDVMLGRVGLVAYSALMAVAAVYSFGRARAAAAQ